MATRITVDKIHTDEDLRNQNLQKHGSLVDKGMLNAGWTPSFVIRVSGSLNILVLRYSTSKDAVWYFDDTGNYLSNTVHSLASKSATALADTWLSILNYYFSSVFFNLENKCSFCEHMARKSQFFSDVLRMADYAVGSETGTAQPKTVRRHADLRKLLFSAGRDTQDSYIREKDRENIVKIDVGTAQYVGTHSIVVSDSLVVYPTRLTNNDFVLIFESGHYNGRSMLYDSQSPAFHTRGGKTVSAENVRMMKLLLSHCADHYPEIIAYFNQPTRATAGIIRNTHLGHNLWNDLTAVHRLENNALITALDQILAYPGGKSELWISVDEFLPTLRPEVVRSLHNQKDLISHVYQNRLFLVRLGDVRIYSEIAERIIRKSLSRSVNVPPKERDELRVVFGLRMENRTWTNQKEGLVEVAKYLSARTSKLTIVVDGHDVVSNTGEVLPSHLEKQDHNIVSMEKELVRYLSRALREPNVEIVDAVAMSLDETIAWLVSSDFFIAPWGAGLAKYKWVCNLPGVVFTSRWNMEHNQDLDIYDSPKYRENAKHSVYVESSAITDEGQGGNVFTPPDNKPPESRASFHVNIDGVKHALNELMSDIGWETA